MLDLRENKFEGKNHASLILILHDKDKEKGICNHDGCQVARLVL